MTNSQELFEIIGTVFPNRIRAALVDCRLTGMAGQFPYELLEEFGRHIEAGCPAHSHFTHTADRTRKVAATQQMMRLSSHSDMVVRYIHLNHRDQAPCEIVALASGPPDTIDQLRQSQTTTLPLSPREMQLTLDLAAGRTLAEVAQSRGVSINTARNQIKTAMRGTGTHSQEHLISIVRDWLL